MARSSTDITCVPSETLGAFPCTDCLNDHQKLALLALLLSAIVNTGTPSSATTLATNAACWKCYDDSSLLSIIVNFFAQYAIAEGYLVAGDLRQLAACLDCEDTKTLKAIIAQLLCEITEAQQDSELV